jgi:UDP-N-acetylmuramoylalanine--D-glutamate ligase
MHHARNIAVLGMGESGEAAAMMLADEGEHVTVLDTGDRVVLAPKIERLKARGITTRTGKDALANVNGYDFAVLSPGIDPAAPLVRNFVRTGIDLLGELELAFQRCACPVIAITGTNGKTTTTQLVARMLGVAGLRTVAAGNIGPAFSAVVSQSSGLDFVTLEVSSFQLETIRTFAPRVAVWLNFAPDHLDRYSSVDDYREAKLRLFENQRSDDLAVVNLREELPPISAQRITFSAYEQAGDLHLSDGAITYCGQPVLRLAETNLRGLHNAENLMAALGVGLALKLDLSRLTPALKQYKPLPHRCELVRQLDGVDYINDSKATNLDALEKALISESRPVVLIAGGKDKGFGFESLTELVSRKARMAVLIGEMSERISRAWSDSITCMEARSLQHAVELARQHATTGDVVLFSPGTSSFDMFKNYADRGNQFRAIVQTL